MAAASSFPLHRLPQKTLKDVIGKMEIFEQTCFSMVSRKTKNLIIEFGNFKGSKVEIKEYVACMFAFGHVTVSLLRGRSRVFSTPRLFNTRSWFNHFIVILQPSELKTLHIENPAYEFDESQFKMIKECLKGRKIYVLSIQSTPRMENILKLVSVFSEANALHLSPNEPLDSSQLLAFRQILQREYHNLNLLNLSLNNLLITRSSVIETDNSNLLTEKNINLFLKHWTAGLMPELKFLSVQLRGHAFNMKLAFRGIPHKIASSRRTFKLSKEEDLLRAGGIDFQLEEGIIATFITRDSLHLNNLFQ